MINIHTLRDIGEDRWDAYIDSCHHSTIYHTTQWRRAFLKSFKVKDYYLAAMSENSQILGILPLFFIKNLREKAFISLPFRDRGGAVLSDIAALPELLKAAKRLCLLENADFIEIKYCWNLGKKEEDIFLSEGFLCNKTTELVTLNLGKFYHGTMEGISDAALGRNIKRALQNNLEIDTDTGIDSLNIFYKLFFNTRKKLGVPVYDFSLFKNLLDGLSLSGYVKLFLVKFNNIAIAGGIFFLFKNRIIYAYGASNEKYLNLRPNDFLFYRVIEWALENNFKILDFGGDSPFLESLIKFKMKWGGEKKSLFSFYYLNGAKGIPAFDYCHPNYDFLRPIIRIMPDTVYKWFSKLAIG